MKKTLLVVAALAVGVAACSPQTIKTEAEKSPSASQKPPGSSKNTAKVGDPLTLKGNNEGSQVRVTVVTVTYPAPPKDEFSGAEQGKVLAGIQLKLENVGTVAYSDSPCNGAKLIDSKSQQYDCSILGETSAGPSLGSDVKIAAGDSRVGYLLFEVPSGTQLASFQFTLDSGFGPETGQWMLSG